MIHGIGNNHTSGMHQVTECIHNHNTENKVGGASLPPVSPNAQRPITQVPVEPAIKEGPFSLATWLQRTLTAGKKWIFRIWGDGLGTTAVGGETENDGTQSADIREDQSAGLSDHSVQENAARHNAEIVAGVMMQSPQNVLQNNPYFMAVPEEKRQSLIQRVRVHFHTITKYLTKQFSGGNFFQTKQEKPKEDLRRHSRYRQDDLEIDCVITDDSYLLDSYDKRGEYSKLSTKK